MKASALRCCLLLLLVFVGEPVKAQSGHDIMGKVTLGLRADPASGVLVVLHSSSTTKTTTFTTGVDGAYYFDGLEDGDYEISFENLEGFLVKRIGGIVFQYPHSVQLADVKMEPKMGRGQMYPVGLDVGPEVVFRVYDKSTAKVLPGAAIVIVGAAGTVQGKTDIYGRYFRVFRPGTYRVSVSADDYTPVEVTLNPKDRRIAREIYLQKAH